MKKKAVFIGISLALASPLYAQDTSFYVGAAVIQTTLETDFVNTSPGVLPGTSNDDDSTALKVLAGVRRQSGNYQYGLEAGYEDGQEKASGLFSLSTPTFIGELEDNYSLSLSLIGGYRILERTYLFGRIGYIRTDFDFKSSSPATTFGQGDDGLSGVQYGVGLDHYLSENVGMRIEYTMTNYLDEIDTIAGPPTPDIVEFDDISRDVLSIGVFIEF